RIDVVLARVPGSSHQIRARAAAGECGCGRPRPHRPCADSEEDKPGFGDHARVEAHARREAHEREVALATRQLLESGAPANGRAWHREVGHDLAGLERGRVDTTEE